MVLGCRILPPLILIVRISNYQVILTFLGDTLNTASAFETADVRVCLRIVNLT